MDVLGRANAICFLVSLEVNKNLVEMADIWLLVVGVGVHPGV